MHTDTVLQHRYTITGHLATGSQATVWQGVDTVGNEPVAIKHASNPLEWPNARRESVLLRLLNLPGVVPIIDEWVDPSGWFVVMPLLAGTAFPEHSDWPRVRLLIQNIATTLSAMHARGIVHADLKPDNILVHGDTATLIDLGFAVDRQAADDISGFTPAYAAPELWFGEQATAAADVFALARMAVNALGVDVAIGPDPASAHTELLRQVAQLSLPHNDVDMLATMLAWKTTDRITAAELLQRLGSDTSPMFEIRSRHRFDHTAEDMRTLLSANAVTLPWLLSSGMGCQQGDAVYFTREEVSRLELALAPRTQTDDGPPLRAVDAGDVGTVLKWCQNSVARPERLRWALPLARWAVGHTQATASPQTSDALALFTSLAVHSEQASAMHDAALAADRASRSPVATQCENVLRAAIAVRTQGRLDSSTARALNNSTPQHPTLGRAMTLVKVWTMRSDMAALRDWLMDELERLDDCEAIGRRLTWLSIVAYKQQDYEAGLAAIERKRELGCEVTLSDLGNEVNLLLESGAHQQAAVRAQQVRQQAGAVRLPHTEVVAVRSGRSAQYRMGTLRLPDPGVVQDAADVSPKLGALMALNEAAVAFRHGLEDAVALVVLAERLALKSGGSKLVALAKALRAAVTHDADLASNVVKETQEGDIGALVVQTLGLCRLAGAELPLNQVKQRVRSPRKEWARRREVLSIDECLHRIS